MIYVIDHQDSFTFNLVHLLSSFDEVYTSNYFDMNQAKLKQSNLVVFSPGPGAPKDYPQSSSIYKTLKGKKKILGICLGFQQILFNEKGKIIQQKKIYHGYQSKIKVLKNSQLFNNNLFFDHWSLSFIKIAGTISFETSENYNEVHENKSCHGF